MYYILKEFSFIIQINNRIVFVLYCEGLIFLLFSICVIIGLYMYNFSFIIQFNDRIVYVLYWVGLIVLLFSFIVGLYYIVQYFEQLCIKIIYMRMLVLLVCFEGNIILLIYVCYLIVYFKIILYCLFCFMLCYVVYMSL